ncbi:hypothetical protein EJ08DRAFT_640974 [Tothia fuscella]|uniref:Uncharacterized protein n=1 Tax=Tothia fuscella TaxID=1048955 RepID=A0A9P4NI86_9PEZI|nr:hypothetical protein EJ08DRAFT_640974 [Tothia fuscella]
MSKPTSIVLAVYTIIGAITLHGFSVRNGFYDLVDTAAKQHFVPIDAVGKMKRSFTGVGPLDQLLSGLVGFFWPMVTKEQGNAGLSLMGLEFAGQGCALVTMIMIEGFRRGNNGRGVSFIAIYSIFIQIAAGFGLAAPLYLLLTTLTSPTFFSPTATDLFVSSIDAIPFGLILGYIIPTIYMSLPSPSILSPTQKVWAIVLWQASPIYAVYIAKAMSALSPHKAHKHSVERQLLHLRAAYKFALIISTVIHILSWTISLSTLLLPSLYTTETATSLHPLNALMPQNPFEGRIAKDVAQGALWFLQWDYWVGGLAYFVYAVGAKSQVGEGHLLKAHMNVVLLGPMGAALWALCERDEAVMAKVGEGELKKGG